MELIKAIECRENGKIDALLADNKTDVNFSNGFTPLWCAITGVAARPEINSDLGSFETVDKLLARGADVHKHCIYIPPIYIATFEQRWDILILILMAGANPNDHAVLACSNNTEYAVAKCRLPIVQAVCDGSYECVDLLISHGALFNKRVINKAYQEMDEAAEYKRKFYDYYYRYKKLKKIIKLLESKYKPEMEDDMKKYLDGRRQTGKYINHFLGVEKLVVDDYF